MHKVKHIDTKTLYNELKLTFQSGGVFSIIAELRKTLDYLTNKLIKGEMRSFTAPLSKIIFISKKYSLPKSISENLKKSYISLLAKETENIGANLKNIIEFIEFLSGESPEESLTQFFKDRIESPQINKKTNGTCSLIKGYILEISDLKGNKGERNYSIKILTEKIFNEIAPPTEISILVKEKIGDKIRQDLIELKKMLWECATINIMNCNASTENQFETSLETLIIIEPDFLIDVTDIAKCYSNRFPNPLIFLIDKLIPEASSEQLLKGSIINDLLDNFLQVQSPDLKEVFRKSLEGNILQAASYGGEKVREIWESVIFEHKENIEKFASSLKNEQIIIEPSFLSPLYGIQGRLDVLTYNENNLNNFDIYELKSGRAPQGTAMWQSNKIQVTLYNMLLSSTYGEKRCGTSAILYSKDKENPLRNHLSEFFDEISIVKTRNQILWIIYRVSEEKYNVLERINFEHFGTFPEFYGEKIKKYSNFYSRLSALKKEYYNKYLSFSLRELLISKIGSVFSDQDRDQIYSRASLWLESRELKESKQSILHSLKFENLEEDKNLIYFEVTKDIVHNFRNGDIIVLYPEKNGELSPLSQPILKGVIKDIGYSHLVIELRNLQCPVKFFEKDKIWAIEPDIFDSLIWTSVKGLFNFLSSKNKFIKLLFREKKPECSDFNYAFQNNLTDNQNITIEKALKSDDFFLLQGPPGTGKTSTALIQIVKEKLEKTDETIAILAFTNKAVNEISKKLSENNLEYLRISHKEADKNDDTITKVSSNMKINQIADFIASKRIFISTVAGFSARIENLISIKTMDTLIIDEASQLTENQIVGILPFFSKLILIGDQKQLPPVVSQDKNYTTIKSEILKKAKFKDMSDSLFERLWEMCQDKKYDENFSMLTHHFRMHPNIAELVNPFYDNALIYGKTAPKAIENEINVIFYPTKIEEKSKINEEEAEKIAILVKKLSEKYNDNLTEDDIGIITPWRVQRSLIANKIKDEKLLKKIMIDTVERFQGAEKNIIIVSLALNNASQIKILESLSKDKKVDRKLNVMISRAKIKLIVFGNESLLRQTKFYHILLKYKKDFPF